MTVKQAQVRFLCIGAAFVVSGAVGVLGWYVSSPAVARFASGVLLLTLAYVAIDAIVRAVELDESKRPIRQPPIDITRYRRDEIRQALQARDQRKDGAA